MDQISFADAEYAGKRKKTRREVFLEEMELVVPWKALLKLIEPFYPVAGRGRRPYPAWICPLQRAPFIVPGRALVGQWGLTPDRSKTLKPTRTDDKPMSTNNCRSETVATAWSFHGPWARGQRCLIPALDYDEPYWGTGKGIWWRFARADGQPWALAGIWNEWQDPDTGEITPSFTMLTQNCDSHPLLNLFHKPDPALPADQQDSDRWCRLRASTGTNG